MLQGWPTKGTMRKWSEERIKELIAQFTPTDLRNLGSMLARDLKKNPEQILLSIFESLGHEKKNTQLLIWISLPNRQAMPSIF